MKNFLGVLIILFLFACSSNDSPPIAPVSNDGGVTESPSDDPMNATKLKMGMFIGIGGHDVSGSATIYNEDGSQIVILNPFSSIAGPDLKVYLSKDKGAFQFVNLGALKNTSGKQEYTIPEETDLSQYHYVHIWCQKFSVEFGRAELQ